jgi:hypothetical protein
MGLRLPIVDIESARLPTLNLSSRSLCLFREEHVSLFQLRHNIGIPFDLRVTNVCAVDRFNYLE